MGGCLLKRLELRPKGAVQFVLISNTICLSCYALLFFLGCDNIQMAGTTIPYTNNSNMEPLKVNLTAACNFNCLCTETDMEPVCGNNGLTYFSPCHAGCAESFSSRSNFANCACGKGYGHIKRAPAYTFGQIPASLVKPVASPNAKAFNIRGITQKGVTKIPGGVVGTQLEPLSDRTRKPGPAAYTPLSELRYKRPPAYTCQPPARPPYQAWDMWTCPPNMYWPYVPSKKAPAYSIGQSVKSRTVSSIPGPGAYDPNFQYQQKTPPAFSFSHPFPPVVPPDYPPPNRYCEKKLLVEKKLAPAPSFGIRHTPYLGEFPAQPKSSKLDLVINAEM